jgi:hypothetical protein
MAKIVIEQPNLAVPFVMVYKEDKKAGSRAIIGSKRCASQQDVIGEVDRMLKLHFNLPRES